MSWGFLVEREVEPVPQTWLCQPSSFCIHKKETQTTLSASEVNEVRWGEVRWGEARSGEVRLSGGMRGDSSEILWLIRQHPKAKVSTSTEKKYATFFSLQEEAEKNKTKCKVQNTWLSELTIFPRARVADHNGGILMSFFKLWAWYRAFLFFRTSAYTQRRFLDAKKHLH